MATLTYLGYCQILYLDFFLLRGLFVCESISEVSPLCEYKDFE